MPTYFHGATGQAYNLSDGVVLTHEGDGIWKAKSPEGDLVLSALISYYPHSEVPAVSDIMAFTRGKGYGRQVLQKLVDHYGELRSSHNGNTSDPAQRMWASLRPRLAWDSEDLPDSKFGGSKRTKSYYYLSRDMLGGSARRVAHQYLSRNGLELSFTVAEETSTHDRENGWVLWRVKVSSERGDEGFMKVSFIPRSNWDTLYASTLHYLNTRNHRDYDLDTPLGYALAAQRELWGLGLLSIADHKFTKSFSSVEAATLSPKDLKRYNLALSRVLTKATQEEYNRFKEFHLEKPLVDYVDVENKGERIGASLYNYTAKWLAAKFGLALWASGLQTPMAKHLWATLTPDPGGRLGSENGRQFLSYVG